jgi:quinol monooxygenase YgiN
MRMVRYTVKPDRASENVELVRAVYDELRSAQPAGFRYATFRLEDGVSFVHLVEETEDEPSVLAETKAFQEFQKNIRERLQDGPVVTELHEIGSYRLLGD